MGYVLVDNRKITMNDRVKARRSSSNHITKGCRKRVVDGGEFEICKKINLADGESSSHVTPVINGSLDDKTTWFVRQYLDMAFSSALCSMAMSEISMPSIKNNGKFIGCRDIASAIPGTVYNILRYNGCQFSKIRFYSKSVNVFEPIWYTMNVDKSSNYLELFINESMIDQFCRKTNNESEFVQVEPTVTRLSNYNLNLGEMQHDMQRFITASVKLVILCDHVCQHIISDLHNRNIPKASKLHDPQFFCKYGTTINSMFRITQTGTKVSDRLLFAQTPSSSSTFLQTNLITNQGYNQTNYLDRLTN